MGNKLQESQLRYYFYSVKQCNMCGSNSNTHTVLGKRLNQSQGKNPKRKTGITTTVMRCTNCRLIYANPQPVPFDIKDHYGVTPEEYWKESYFKADDVYFQAEIKQLKSLMTFSEGMKSLDIGAGLGKAMIALSKAGFDAYGLESSEQFYERAISKMGLLPSHLKLSTIEAADYPEDTFDFISFGAVLEHLYNPSASVLKAMAWLKPGGILHIEVPSSNWLISKLANLYYRFIGSDYVANISPMHQPYHLYEFGLKSFQLHAKEHNYDLIFYEYYVCQTYLPKITNPFIIPYMKFTNTGMQLCVWLKKK